MAWALPEGTPPLRRTLLSMPSPSARAVVRSGLRSGLGVDTVRQQVQGAWSAARVHACLPRLRRFLCSRPRRRGHQESAVRAGWARARPPGDRQPQVA